MRVNNTHYAYVHVFARVLDRRVTLNRGGQCTHREKTAIVARTAPHYPPRHSHPLAQVSNQKRRATKTKQYTHTHTSATAATTVNDGRNRNAHREFYLYLC